MKRSNAAMAVSGTLAGFLCLATPAQACRTLEPNAATLAEYTGVVLVDVETSKRLDNPGWNSWEIEARSVKPIEGAKFRMNYIFRTTQSSDGCGTTHLPRKGEKWVVYLAPSDSRTVEEAYPLALARGFDKRLTRIR